MYLYILQSASTGRYYIGTTDNLDRRLAEHTAGVSPATRNRGPWQVVYTELHPDRSSAMKREYQLKSWKSHQAIAALIAARG